jgi:DNA-binding IclR family transcriptional regulator
MTHDDLFERIIRLLAPCPYSAAELAHTLDLELRTVHQAIYHLTRTGRIRQTARDRKGGPFYGLVLTGTAPRGA